MVVKVIDHGYRKLLDTFSKLGLRNTVITVGIHEADGRELHEGSELGETVAEIAAMHEFGLGVPQRSFIRSWFEENRSKNQKALANMMRSVLKGKRTREQAMNLLGQAFVGQIQRKIAQGIPPPNSPITIALKGSSKPLIDTGQLRTSITYAIDGKLKPSKAAVKREKKAARDKKKAKRTAARERKKAIKKVVRATRSFGKKAVKAVKRNAKKAVKRLTKKSRRKKRS